MLLTSNKRQIYVSFILSAIQHSFNLKIRAFPSFRSILHEILRSILHESPSNNFSFVRPPYWIPKFTRPPFKLLTVYDFWLCVFEITYYAFHLKWSFTNQCRNIVPSLLLFMILLHFIFVREILENEMTQVTIDNFKEIKQLKILWVL